MKGREARDQLGRVFNPPSGDSRGGSETRPTAGARFTIAKRAVALLATAGLAFAAEDSTKVPVADQPSLMVVVGAAGDPEFASDFTAQLETWRKIGAQAGAKLVTIGEGETSAEPVMADRDRFKAAIDAEPKDGPHELWIVLIGHGTFDGREAKFNFRGPDISAAELAEWLKPVQRPLAVIDTASSSAPFLNQLTGPRRVVVTSTRSGHEQNYARFGKFFAEAMADAKSDLDKDGQVSLLEAFLTGSHRTAEFYKTEGRLATEHALIDDNGDGLGTPADWFRGVRATKRARDGAALDGLRAQQMTLVRSAAEQQLTPAMRERRDELELQIAKLREEKPKIGEPAYFRELEKLLLDLAALYEGT